jgi:hypothetical protein
MGTLTFYNPLGHSRPVTGLLLTEELLASQEKLHHTESVVYVNILCTGYRTLPLNAILSQFSVLFLYTSGSQIVLCGSRGIREQFPEDPWKHLCNGYFEVYLFLKLKK